MKKRYLSLILALLMIISIMPMNVFASTEISRLSVCGNTVSGRTDNYADVYLYTSTGKKVASDYTGSSGYFELTGDFVYDRYYRDGYYPYYGYYGIYSISDDGYRITAGKTEPYAYVEVRDSRGYTVESGRADKYGYFEISHSSINPSDKKIVAYIDKYSDYYYDGYYYDYRDLSDYYIVVEKDGKRVSREYLSKSDISSECKYYDYKYYDYRYYDYKDYKYSDIVITSAKAGDDSIRGYGIYPYASIVARDSNKNLIGSTTADSKGNFTLVTDRTLWSEESIDLIIGDRDYRDGVKTITVSKNTSYIYNPSTNNSSKYMNKFFIGKTTYEKTVNGVKSNQVIDVKPYIKDGRTMLPMRYVAEALGYSVTWDEATSNAAFIKGNTAVVINIWSDEYTVNGAKHTFAVKPETVNGRTMLPITEVALALGLTHGNVGDGRNIEWDAANQAVIVQSF